MSRNGVGGGGQSRNSQVESKCQAAEAEAPGAADGDQGAAVAPCSWSG